MKKLISLLLAAMMTLSLCACGGGAPADTPAKEPASSGTSSGEPSGASSGDSVTFTYCVHSSTGCYAEAMDKFAEKLSELSGGRIVGSGYTAGTMGTEAELTDAVIMGDLTMSTPADTLTLQAFNLDDWESLPGLVASQEEANKYLLSRDGYMSQILDRQFADKGVVRLGGMDNGFRMIASKNKLETADDLKGLKMRTASVWAMVNLYEGVGAIPTVVDSSEVVTALEQGTVDAMENGFANLANQGFADLLDWVLAVNYIYSARSVICNLDWFNALSAEDQDLVYQAADYACDWANDTNAETVKALENDPRWTVYDLSDDQRAAFQSVADSMWEEVSGTYDQEVMSELLAHR